MSGGSTCDDGFLRAVHGRGEMLNFGSYIVIDAERDG